jgi:hypothetical protein
MVHPSVEPWVGQPDFQGFVVRVFVPGFERMMRRKDSSRNSIRQVQFLAHLEVIHAI